MLKKLYLATLFVYPKRFITVVAVIALMLGYFATKLEIDASAETLLLEGDKDLEFSRKVSKLYESPDFLVITFTPKEALLADTTLNTIRELSKELEKLVSVDSVTSILNVPLLQSPPKPVKELLKDIPSLESKDADKVLARKEFLESPLYKEHLVSKDFKTTALLVNLTTEEKYIKLRDHREELLKLRREKKITLAQIEELKGVQKDFKIYRDRLREDNHQNIIKIRQIMTKYKKDARLYLGGVGMIADDMVTFVASDLSIFGTSVLVLLILILGGLFREIRWVMIPITVCVIAVTASSGLLGMFGWEITVVSSNFISLQLILTISLVIHLSVKYRELLSKNPDATQKELVLETVLSMFNPSFFVVATTIAGFTSLVLSQILPVINFGWMMSIGVSLSLLVTFIVFPAILLMLKKRPLATSVKSESAFTAYLAVIADKYKKLIVFIALFLVAFAITGAMKLFVENSFIDYFKEESEIHQGMKVIDQELGGTTPLDVIITFKEDEAIDVAVEDAVDSVDEADSFDDNLDSFDDEFESEENPEKYWFTENKMDKIQKVHQYLESLPEVGKVLSLFTMGEVGKVLNSGDKLESFELALLNKELPEEYRKIVLDPYMNIAHNQVRITMRILDSQKDLRRDALIKKINKDVAEILNPEFETFRLSNMLILYNNMLNSLFDSQMRTLGFVVLILLIMFLFVFRSLKVAAIALSVNIIPVAVIFGFMGWLHIPLDMMTITIAAISFGIAVDDTIHYIYRYKIEFAKTGDYKEAMYNAHKSIGTAMLYTSISIMIGFSVLVLSNFIPTIYFGLLTCLAMFMAIVADLLLLPVLLTTFKPFGRNS
jgi:predicted RND superfamily exporter protein